MFVYFGNFKVGVCLVIVFVFIVVLLVVVSIIVFIKINNINCVIDQIVNDCYLKVCWVFDLCDGVNEQIKYLCGMVIDIGNLVVNEKCIGQLDVVVCVSKEVLDKIMVCQVIVVGQKKVKVLDDVCQLFEISWVQFLVLIWVGQGDVVDEFVLCKIIDSQNVYFFFVIVFVDFQDSQLCVEGVQVVVDGVLVIQVILVCLVVVVLVVILLGYLMVCFIVKLFNEVVCVVENVVVGDLIMCIELYFRDEMGQLMVVLCKMNDNLVDIVFGVCCSIDLIVIVLGEIVSGNMDLLLCIEQ